MLPRIRRSGVRITLGALGILRSQYAPACRVCRSARVDVARWSTREEFVLRGESRPRDFRPCARPSILVLGPVRASLSRLLARAHEALTRNAINLAAVACLPAFGFGVPGPSCHEVPTRVPHAADEVVDGARPTSACAMGSIPLPAALNGLGRLLHLRKPRHWAGGARCESQREDQGRLRASPPRQAESSTRALGSMLAGHASPRLSSCRSRRDKQHRGTPEGGIDRPAERVYGEICGLESIPTAGGFLLVLPVDLPPFLGLRRPVIGVAALAKRAA